MATLAGAGQGGFWAVTPGHVDAPTTPTMPGDPETLIVDPWRRRPSLVFLPAPEEDIRE